MTSAQPGGGAARRVATIAAKEIAETIRDRRTMLVTLLPALLAGPLLLALVFHLVSSQLDRTRALRLPVVGADRAPALVAFLTREDVGVENAAPDYEARLRNGELEVVLAIDEDFARDVAQGRSATVRVIADRSRDRARVAITETEALLRAFNARIGQSRLLLRGIAPDVAQPISIETVDLATPQQSGALLLFLIAYYGLFASVMGGMAVALDLTAGERERASLEPLLATPARPIEIAFGKWIAAASFALAIVVLTLAGFWVTLAFAPLPPVGVPFLFTSRELGRFIAILLPIVAMMPAILLWFGIRARAYKEAQANVSLLLFAVSIIPVLHLFLQRREPDWLVAMPVSGQYLLLQRALRGELVVPSDLALSYVAPWLIALLAIGAVSSVLSRESVLAGR
jgi:sodium transport system permease protein